MAKPTVFVVEHDELIASALRALLEEEFEVCLSGWNAQTIRHVHERAPMVILLDLDTSSTSPSEDGVVMLQQLRQAGHTGKIIVYTATTERSLAVQAIQHGACEILTKPLDLTVLKPLVCRVARIADLEQDARGAITGTGHEEFSGMLGTSPSDTKT